MTGRLTSACGLPGCTELVTMPAVMCHGHTALAGRSELCELRRAWRSGDWARIDQAAAAAVISAREALAELAAAESVFGIPEPL